MPVIYKLPIGTAYTEIQQDVLGRNYILDALDSSIEAVNQGIAALKRTPTNAHIHAHVIEKKARDVAYDFPSYKYNIHKKHKTLG